MLLVMVVLLLVVSLVCEDVEVVVVVVGVVGVVVVRVARRQREAKSAETSNCKFGLLSLSAKIDVAAELHDTSLCSNRTVLDGLLKQVLHLISNLTARGGTKSVRVR